MSNEDPTFKIPAELVQPVIDSHINAAIIQALEGKDQLVSKAILSVLQTHVDDGGKPTNSNYRAQPWIDWVIGNCIREATTETVRGYIADHQKQIEAALIAELSKRNSPLVKQLVSTVVLGMGKAAASKWHFNVDMTFKDQD